MVNVQFYSVMQNLSYGNVYTKICCFKSISAVARSMAELEPLVLVQEKMNITRSPENTVNSHPYDTLPLFSMAQEGRLDTFILKLEDAFEKNQLTDITTSAVMELYEYKVSSFI